ncbi:flagellar protein FliS [Balnearium lithotrophicum]|uniref:Flagellar protein FliS n=1 Tax=Balnearium lithotrophicum TaxID=223788 RepID=A0A521DBD8_9BACT|nr:flagellar export chaperone FliS [Balnearium lithotrophicum]SMO69029.1 flagellar protein FliS [Balnearium lithotrophicum]
MRNPYATYMKTEEEVLTNEGLLLKAYEEMISLLNISIFAIDEGDVKTKAESLTKVTNALSVMQASLDFEKGGEIAKNLDKLYDFCILELVKANATNDKERIKNVKEILETVYSGFKEALENNESK